MDMYANIINGSETADTLVVNAGHHDLIGLDLITYIATMSDVFKIFRRLMDLRNSPKIIWIETMPTHPDGLHGGYMTNQVVEGVNDWVNFNMYNLGVEVVHAYNIVIPMTSNHKGYGVHYYHFLGPLVRKGQKVSVGGAIVSVLVHIICPKA